MTSIPSPEEVWAATAELPGLYLTVANELFQTTWQVSHVRYVELLSHPGAKPAVLLAYALARGRQDDHALHEWLPNVEFCAASPDQLARLVAHALSDMAEEGRPYNGALFHTLSQLNLEPAQPPYEVKAGARKQGPFSTHSVGPTYQMFWFAEGRLHLLEVHNES